MYLYQALSRIPGLKKSFSLKILSIAFLVIQLPLLVVIFWLLNFDYLQFSAMTIVSGLIGFSVLTMVLTVIFLNNLLLPIEKVKNSLEHYLNEKRLPDLPNHYGDEVGSLMSGTQYALTQLDTLIDEKRSVLALLTNDLKNGFASIVNSMKLVGGGEDDRANVMRILQNAATTQADFYARSMEILLNDKFNARFTKNIREIDLCDLVEDIVQSRNASVQYKELKVIKDIPHQNITVKAEILSKVFASVYDNAIKFTPRTGSMSIEGGIYDNQVMLKIRDSGVGFEREEADKVFLIHSPLRRRGTEGEKSRGVGMYLSKTLLEKNGGAIYASSEGPGKGATFVISMQLEAEEVPA